MNANRCAQYLNLAVGVEGLTSVANPTCNPAFFLMFVEANMAAASPIKRTVDFTSRPMPRERPARAAARSRQLRKRSTSPGRQTYCQSSAYQNPKQAISSPGGFRDLMSAMAADVMSAMTHPHCMEGKGSPCSAPRRALCFSPDVRKTNPQWS